MSNIDSIINSVKMKYAPDKRTAIFNVAYNVEENKIEGETNSAVALDELKKELNLINLKFEVELLPSKKLEGKHKGIVTLSVVNMRSSPGHSHEMVTQSILGTQVNVYKKSKEWYYIQTPDNYLGWVEDDAFTFVDDDQLKDWNESVKIIFTDVYGFAYSQPDEESEVVSDLVVGNILRLVDDVNSDFYLVKYPDGREGYVMKKSSSVFTEWLAGIERNEENIIKTARRFIGIPYLWGGTSSKALDCSGFTKTVYFLNGVIIQRDASQQVLYGEFVTENPDEYEKMRPGDLLFFGRKATEDRKEGITHVGIYIGGGEYIHEAGRVKINSLIPSAPNFSKGRYNSFIRTKRYLNSIPSAGIELIKGHNAY